MRISLRVIIYLMTASVRLSPVTGNKGGHVDMNYWNDMTPVTITQNTGYTAQIECSYPRSHENNEKFLCKGANPSNYNQLINTSEQERDVVKGRFHIIDNRSYFYVYINDLSTEDSGYYWCGSSKTGERVGSTKILLSVVTEEHIKTKRSDPPALQTTASSTTRRVLHSDLIAVVIVCLALLLIPVLVFILCKHKLPRTQVCCAAGGSSEQRTNEEHYTEENHGDHHYDEIQMQNQQASSGDAMLSVYATVNPPADQLHYASVKFSTKRNAPPDTDKTCSSTCDYSISRSQGDFIDIDDSWVWVSHRDCEEFKV
ncbi:transmembrane domain-containing protein TMIGD3-like [Cebidichthys violaceus]|uniref:transmembrane domain-containing protein TMIGD3-like n=1 Tax=Cebidichthys violaceus TaxID=271503 RepID=UPI0035C9F364